MKFLIFMTVFISIPAFAQTECYFDNNFEDGIYHGFFLQEEEISFMSSYNRFDRKLKRSNDLLIDANGTIVGQIKLSSSRGILSIGKELASFKCVAHTPRGHGK